MATFVLNTNGAFYETRTYVRSGNPMMDPINDRQSEMSEILFQVHAPHELAQMLGSNTQSSGLETLTLKAGNEYTIELDPNGRLFTERFTSLDFEERGCYLKSEAKYTSDWLKDYSKPNCKYECMITKAYETCGCVPWEYIHPFENTAECDVFGRTCFKNVIKNVSYSENNLCLHCIDSCGFLEYQKV